METNGCRGPVEPPSSAKADYPEAYAGEPQINLALDASAAVALHFADGITPFAEMEDMLTEGEEAFTAPNFFQKVMEARRRAIREQGTTNEHILWKYRPRGSG